MKMQSLAIFLLAGLMFLPMAFTDATAIPTVINIAYSAQPQTSEDLTLQMHAFGFPGEELGWSGQLVLPASQDTQPSWTSSITVTSASYSDTGVSVSFKLADSSNPDYDGCPFQVSANVYGHIYLTRGPYMPGCPQIQIDDYWAIVVINT